MNQHHYLNSVDAVFLALGSGKDGLAADEARARHDRFGANELARAKKKSMLARFGEQLLNPMVIVLMAAAAVSILIAVFGGGHGGGHGNGGEVAGGGGASATVGGGVGEFMEAFIIIAVVILNSILGVFQESKAEKAIEALQEMSAATARVRRGGAVAQIPASELVVGDVVLIEAGDALPADMRLIHSASLRIEEAALTGESVPVDKVTEALRVGDTGGAGGAGDDGSDDGSAGSGSSGGSSGGGSLLIETDAFARCVELSASNDGDEFGFIFSDNYFDMIPGQPIRIQIAGRHKKGIISAKAHYSPHVSTLDWNI